VCLPRVEPPARRDESLPGVEAPPRGSETVLLAEDEAEVRALTRSFLQQGGYQVLDAGNGEEVLRLALEYRKVVHLLVTDVVIPGLGGRQLAARLRALHPEVRVLYLSGHTDDAVLRHGVLQEQVQFLQKPFSPLALARKVREVLDAPPARGS
jgi:two-component system, cell cycle sensor histidine kinase and response regulator CckA